MSQKSVPLLVTPHWSFIVLPGLQLLGLMFLSKVQGLSMYSFVLISLFVSWRLFSDGRPYSLNKLFWLFCLLFFSVFPSIAFTRPELAPAAENIQDANLVILISLLLYEGIRLWASGNFVPQAEGTPPAVPGVLLRQFAHFAPPIILSCGAALVVLFGFIQPFAPLAPGESSWMIVITPLLRATMLWCCITSIILYRQHRLGPAILLLVLIPGFLFNLPTALPAPLCFTVFLGWLLAAGPFTLRRPQLFAWTLIGYFLLIDPACESLRQRMTPETGRNWKGAWKEQLSNAGAWTSLDLSIREYPLQEHITGRQLIGSALFFVPRAVWPTKPDGSELYLKEKFPERAGTGCTFIAEGFLNFGIWGVCVFSAALALIVAGYDGWYWRRGGHLRFTLPRLFYFMSFGLLHYFLIGDLQQALFTGTLFAFTFTVWQSLFFWRIAGPKYQLHY